MPLVNKHIHPYGSIALWYIDETPDVLNGLLTIDEFVPFKTEKRNLHWIAARLALQEAVGRHSAKIIKNNEGKPFLSDKDGHISMTHSGNMAAAIFNKTELCGIDLEVYDPRISRIGHKFTSVREFGMMPDSMLNACLCLLWSAKESVFKFGSIHEVDFREQIRMESLDFDNQCLYFHFTRPEPAMKLRVFYRVYEVVEHHVMEIPLLTDLEMEGREIYVLTWI